MVIKRILIPLFFIVMIGVSYLMVKFIVVNKLKNDSFISTSGTKSLTQSQAKALGATVQTNKSYHKYFEINKSYEKTGVFSYKVKVDTLKTVIVGEAE